MHPCVIWLHQGAGKMPFRYCLREYWGRQSWGDLPCRGNPSRCNCPYPPQPGSDDPLQPQPARRPPHAPPEPAQKQLSLL